MAIVTIGRTAAAGPVPQVSTSFGMGQFSVRVYSKTRWDDTWLYEPYLTPVNAKEVTTPNRSSATFVYEHGDIKREDWPSFAKWAPNEILFDLYVTIVVTPDGHAPYAVWCGMIPVEHLRANASQPAANTIDASGTTQFTAHGFDYILSRRQMNTAFILPDPLTSPFVEVNWSPDFNLPEQRGLTNIGNRSSSRIQIGGSFVAYGFADRTEADPAFWSIFDILEYLLYFSDNARDLSPGAEPEIRLGMEASLATFLRSIVEVIDYDKGSVWDIVKRLISRKRGITASFVWGVDSAGLPSSDPVHLTVYSMIDYRSMVGDAFLPANPFRERMFIDAQEPDVDSAVVVRDSVGTYDTVVVRGERVRSAFTMSTLVEHTNFAEIQPGWSAAQKMAYDAATPAERAGSTHDNTYRLFTAPDNFNWQIGGSTYLNPSFDNDAVIDLDTQDTWWNKYNRVLNWLPFQEHAFLIGENVDEAFAKPFVVFEEVDRFGAGLGRWVVGHKGSRKQNTVDIAVLIPQEYPSVEVSPSNRSLSVIVKAKTNHLIAVQHILDSNIDIQAEEMPVFDYDRMLVTVAVETDTRPMARLATGAPQIGLIGRSMTIDVRDAQVWIVAPGTVVGVGEDGRVLFHTGPRVMRDDTLRLRQVAAMAAAWFSRYREAIDVRRKGLLDNHWLGTMLEGVITYAGHRSVNSIVTHRSWDFRDHATTIKTGFVEMDVK